MISRKQDADVCDDCGVAIGRYHKMGCWKEQCPFCFGQLKTCRCSFVRLSISRDDDLTLKQKQLWRKILRRKGRIEFGAEPLLDNMYDEPELSVYAASDPVRFRVFAPTYGGALSSELNEADAQSLMLVIAIHDAIGLVDRKWRFDEHAYDNDDEDDNQAEDKARKFAAEMVFSPQYTKLPREIAERKRQLLKELHQRVYGNVKAKITDLLQRWDELEALLKPVEYSRDD